MILNFFFAFFSRVFLFFYLPLQLNVFGNCVKDISGTTALSILKFCTNIEYEILYSVKK